MKNIGLPLWFLIVIWMVSIGALALYSQQAPAPQVNRPSPTVDDVFNRLGRCQVEVDAREKYIQQLEGTVTTLQAQIAELTKPPEKEKPKAPAK